MFNNEEGSKQNSDDAKSTTVELFPWVSEFKKMCKCNFISYKFIINNKKTRI